MKRRAFLSVAITGALSSVPGCGDKGGARQGKVLEDPLEDDTLVDMRRFEMDRERFDRHRAICKRYPVAAGEVRTTPGPAVDVAALVPELAGHRVTAVRLHPRYGAQPPIAASKLGGHFLWPEGESWPTCREHGIPYATVLQLRGEEFPEVALRPGTDLMQLLWCPRDHVEWVAPALFWRRRADVTRHRGEIPISNRAFLEYVPLPCRLMPERVVEFPNLYDFYKVGIYEDPAKTTVLGRALTEWGRRSGREGDMCDLYERELSIAKGTKVGGYPRGLERAEHPACARCGRAMDYLLTIDSTEWEGGSRSRWCPLEDRKHADASDWEGYEAASAAHGLGLGDLQSIAIFLCRACPDWPIRHVIRS